MRSVLPFTSSILATLLVAASLSYWSDPAARWSRKEGLYPNHPIPLGQVWLAPKARFDAFRVRTDEIRWSTASYAVFFGSSRIFSASSKALDTHNTLLNLGMGHAELPQEIALWDLLKRAGKVPRLVLVEVDPWILDEREPDVHKNFRLFPERMQAHRDGFALINSQDLVEEAFVLASNFHDLLQWSNVYFASRQAFFSVQRVPEMPFVTENQIPNQRYAFRTDGSVITPSRLHPYSAEDTQQEFKTAEPLGDPWRLDSIASARFGAWLDDMIAHGCQVHVFLPPFHPALYHLYQTDRPDVLTQFQTAVHQAVSRRPGTVLCDMTNPVNADCGENSFVDGLHVDPPCLARLVTQCLDGSKNGKLFLRKSQ